MPNVYEINFKRKIPLKIHKIGEVFESSMCRIANTKSPISPSGHLWTIGQMYGLNLLKDLLYLQKNLFIPLAR